MAHTNEPLVKYLPPLQYSSLPFSLSSQPLVNFLYFFNRTVTIIITMQQAIPYRTWTSTSGASAASSNGSSSLSLGSDGGGTGDLIDVTKLVSENAVVVLGRRGCCMCHVVRKLLLGHGVNPRVIDVDETDEAAIIQELSKLVHADDRNNGLVQFPAVFVGGKLFGGLEKVMATHISGELVPILRQAGALWL